jgi:hypothetical protein
MNTEGLKEEVEAVEIEEVVETEVEEEAEEVEVEEAATLTESMMNPEPPTKSLLMKNWPTCSNTSQNT